MEGRRQGTVGSGSQRAQPEERGGSSTHESGFADTNFRDEVRGGSSTHESGFADTNEGVSGSSEDGIAGSTLKRKREEEADLTMERVAYMFAQEDLKGAAKEKYPVVKMSGVKWEQEIKPLVKMMRKMEVLKGMMESNLVTREFVLEELGEILEIGDWRYFQLQVASREGWDVAGKLEKDLTFGEGGKREKALRAARKRAKLDKEIVEKKKGEKQLPSQGAVTQKWGGYGNNYGNGYFGNGGRRVVWQANNRGQQMPWNGGFNYGGGGAQGTGGWGQNWGGNSQQSGVSQGNRNLANMVCYSCHGVGHIAANCPTNWGQGGRQ